ncbi:MAG: flagellar hook-basal body complex protein, partial [Pseudomonadales bacterium]|nr:flagellar hook-basal body complex protein [Pseudomonadales bacterium]
MSFNTALTGLRSANKELEVAGNNIANASTVGFKESRAEFSDVYANGIVGSGADAVGSGVRVSDIAQQFSQGNIGFSENALDLAINGGGFFVLSNQGAQSFSRAGQFGVDDTGFITNNSGGKLQGFSANDAGDLSGVTSDLRLDTVNIDPRQTSEVNIGFNLNADSLVLADRGNSVSSDGTEIGVVQVGSQNGYSAGTIDIDGVTVSIPLVANQSAQLIAASLSAVDGVSAVATNTASFSYAPGGGGTTISPGEFRINGRDISGASVVEVAQSINSQLGLSASVSGTDITVTATDGADLVFNVSSGASALAVTVSGQTITQGVGPLTNQSLTQGGTIAVNLDEGITFTNGSGNIFSAAPALFPFEENTFDPNNQATYNDATSVTVYDSLGSAHVLEMFFVKESTSNNPANTWSMYVQIDGQNV